MPTRRLASLALALTLAFAAPARAASLTPPNLVTASSLNSQDLLLVWPYAAGGPLEAMNWSTFTGQMQGALGGSFLTPSHNLSDLGNPTTARTNLGLGTAATANTGTSGGTLCLLNTSCTVSGTETHSGEILVAPSSSANAGINLAPGVAPASPNNGDVWTTSSGFFAQINGATQQTVPVKSGTLTPTLAYETPGTSSFSYTMQSGNYVCIAGVVSGWARVIFTPTNGTASGHLGWNNAPYSPSTNNANVSAGLGPSVGFAGGWASMTATYSLAAFSANFLTFQNNGAFPGAGLTTANATTGTSKEAVWEFNYLTSTGAC